MGWTTHYLLCKINFTMSALTNKLAGYSNLYFIHYIDGNKIREGAIRCFQHRRK